MTLYSKSFESFTQTLKFAVIVHQHHHHPHHYISSWPSSSWPSPSSWSSSCSLSWCWFLQELTAGHTNAGCCTTSWISTTRWIKNIDINIKYWYQYNKGDINIEYQFQYNKVNSKFQKIFSNFTGKLKNTLENVKLKKTSFLPKHNYFRLF